MLLDAMFIADWEATMLRKYRKQKDLDKSNTRENNLRINNDYQVSVNVLIIDKDIYRKLKYPIEGPYVIIEFYTNSTLCIQNGIVTECIIIRRCSFYTTHHKLGGGGYHGTGTSFNYVTID